MVPQRIENIELCARRSWRDPAGGRPARVRGSARPLASDASSPATARAKRSQRSCGVGLSHEIFNNAGAEPVIHVEGNMCGGAVALPGSKATSRTKGSHRNLGDLVWPAVATAIPGRGRKARSRRCLGTGEESDGPRSTGEAPEQGRDERRRRAWREGGSVGGMADDGRCSGRRTGPSILYPPLACGSATRSNVRARPIALDFRQEPGAGKPHAGICAGGQGAIPVPTATAPENGMASDAWNPQNLVWSLRPAPPPRAPPPRPKTRGTP